MRQSTMRTLYSTRVCIWITTALISGVLTLLSVYGMIANSKNWTDWLFAFAFYLGYTILSVALAYMPGYRKARDDFM